MQRPGKLIRLNSHSNKKPSGSSKYPSIGEIISGRGRGSVTANPHRTATSGSRSLFRRFTRGNGNASQRTHDVEVPFDESFDEVFQKDSRDYSDGDPRPDMFSPWIYDETPGHFDSSLASVDRKLRGEGQYNSDDSILFELMSVENRRDNSAKPQHPLTVSHAYAVGVRGDDDDDAEPPDLANVSDESEISEKISDSSDSACSASKKIGKKGVACAQDTFLECAEFSVKSISNVLWSKNCNSTEPKQCGSFEPDASKNGTTKIELTRQVSTKLMELMYNDESDEDVRASVKESEEALKAMLSDVVRSGSTLVTTTFDSIRQAAADITGDGRKEAHDDDDFAKDLDEESSIVEVLAATKDEKSTKFVEDPTFADAFPPVVMDLIIDCEMDGDEKAQKAQPSDLQKTESAKCRKIQSKPKMHVDDWETFHDVRQIGKIFHFGNPTRSWSAGFRVSEAESFDSDEKVSVAGSDPTLDIKEFLFQTGSDWNGTTQKLGKEIGYVISRSLSLEDAFPRRESESATPVGTIAIEVLTALQSDLISVTGSVTREGRHQKPDWASV